MPSPASITQATKLYENVEVSDCPIENQPEGLWGYVEPMHRRYMGL